MYYHDNHGEFYTIWINITVCLFIQNTILNSLTEGHYIEVYGNVKYGIGQKIMISPYLHYMMIQYHSKTIMDNI